MAKLAGVVRDVKKRAEQAGGYRALGRALGVSQTAVWRVGRKGDRPSDALLEALGWRREENYVRERMRGEG